MSFVASFSPYDITNYGLVRLPNVAISKEQKETLGLPPEASNYEFLTQLAREGFKQKRAMLSKSAAKRYGDRAKYELEIFEELGFTDYVLLVWLVISRARQTGVFIDYGRGSCAGSLIFWLLGITGVDPVDKGLFFERFVSRVRSKKQVIDGHIYLKGDLIADADLNLGEGRDEIVKWLREVYPNRISKILNLSTFTGKILIKDVYKTFEEVSEEEATRVSNLIEKHFGIVEDIGDAYKNNEAFKAWADQHQQVYQIALKLNNLIRQTSVHASGYVVSFYDLTTTIPIEIDKEGEWVSGYDMREVCNFAIKLDLLGLTTNRIVAEVRSGIEEDIAAINLDSDPLIYDQFQQGQLLPYGLYQISADCAYGVLNKIKPKSIFELSDVNACARPGALSYVDGYVEGNHPCPHPLFENILKRTRNYCLYQEQMMQLLIAVGFTAEESETCRKIVGKKEVHKVQEWKEKIYAKIKENGLPENLGDILWKILEDSSRYSFNLSHSLATSYLSALTVYLKYKYPARFYCACLNAAHDMARAGETPQDQIGYVTRELAHFGIKLLPPDIHKSSVNFTLEDGNIRFGLKLLKGIAEKGLERLELFRAKSGSNKFETLQAMRNQGLNIGICAALIQAGCLSDYETYYDKHGKPYRSRSRLVLEACLWCRSDLLNDKERGICLTIGANPHVQWDVIRAIRYLTEEMTDEKGNPMIKPSRFATIKKRYEPYKKIYEMNSRNERLANYWYERQILGYSYSESLGSIFGEYVQGLMSVKEALNTPPNTFCRLIGFATNPIKNKTKKGNQQFRFTLTDETGEINVKAFNERIEVIEEQNGRLVEDDDLVIVNGKRMEGNTVFVQQAADGTVIGIQTCRIYMKLSEMRDAKAKEPERAEAAEVPLKQAA